MGLPKHFQMLRYRRGADGKPLCYLAGRPCSGGKYLDDPLAGGVGKSRDAQHTPLS
jgi:hypothetical protein